MGEASTVDIFPSSPIDWTDLYQRAEVMSKLVREVSLMERDTHNKRKGEDAQAQTKLRLEPYDFSLHETLIEECDGSICGAIFEYNSYDVTSHFKVAPRYVIAFRGTILHPKTGFTDVILDIQCIFNNLHTETRFKNAIQTIEETVEKHGKEAVWLAGHSLGAAIALLAGKTMAMSGCPLEAYIFNPPISSCFLILLKKEEYKLFARIATNIFKAIIVEAMDQDKSEEKESFMSLASWIPNLFVNPLDPICSEYIDHFNIRVKISEIGKFVKLPTRFTVSSLEPLHLLPSARLIINTSNLEGMHEAHMIKQCLEAHKIKQWWDPESKFETKLFESLSY